MVKENVVCVHNGMSLSNKATCRKWIELEDIMVSEITLSQKDKYHIFFLPYVEAKIVDLNV
jgi:hypothetical protein